MAIKGLLTVFIQFIAGVSFASNPLDFTTTCETFEKPVAWSYCKSATQGSKSSDVLYYFHGAGGSEHEWELSTTGKEIRAEWAAQSVEAPTVVNISFGPFWLLVEKNESEYSGLYEFVAGYAIPNIEAGLGGLKGRRLLIGVSMGGFNAAQLYLKQGALFSQVVLACPAVMRLSPFSTQTEIDEYIARYNVDREKLTMFIEIGKHFFSKSEQWQTASPYDLATRLAGPQLPPVHISCGDVDELGFFGESKAFYDLVSARGARAIWQPLKGPHCTVDPVAVADFLVTQ